MEAEVVYLGRFGTCCGVSTYTEQLAEQLVQQGCRVTAVASEHGHRECGPHRVDCIETIRTIPCWTEDGDLQEAAKVILDVGPLIVHVQHEFGIFRNHKALLELIDLLRQSGIKVVVTAHTVPANEAGGLVEIARRSDGVVTHSHRAKVVLERHLEHFEYQPVVLHLEHGMLPPQPKVDQGVARMMLALPPDENVVVALALGFISRSKKHMVMLQALEAANQKQICHPYRLFLLIAGMPDPREGDELVRLLRLTADRMKIADSMLIIPEFVPFRMLPILYGASDFTLHVRGTSHLSSSGSIRQDLSFKMPVLTQRSELTDDLPNDTVMFFANDQSMLSLMPALVRRQDKRKTLSDNAALMARTFEWRRIASRHLSFYESIIGFTMGRRRRMLRTALGQATSWLRLER
jgi:hypothetical protein